MKKNKNLQSKNSRNVNANLKDNVSNNNVRNKNNSTNNNNNTSNKDMGFDVESSRSFKMDENNEHSFELRDE